MAQIEDYSWGDSLSNSSEELLWRSMVFSTFTSCQNKEHQTSQGYVLSRFQKQTDQHSTYTASQYVLGNWEGCLIMEGIPALPSQERRHLIFIFNMDILLINAPFSLMIKADV